MAPGAVSYRPCRVRRGVRLNWRRGNAGGCPFDACDQGRHERRVLATGVPVAVENSKPSTNNLGYRGMIHTETNT